MRVTLDLDEDQVTEVVVKDLQWHYESDMLDRKTNKLIKKTMKFYMPERAFREYMDAQEGKV